MSGEARTDAAARSSSRARARTAYEVAIASAVRVGRALVPPSCVACRKPLRGDRTLCEGCELRISLTRPIAGAPPPGIDRAWSAAHHDGIARELVSALKHRRVLGAAKRIGAEIARAAPSDLIAGTLVPAPSSPSRRLSRGFEPAAEIARVAATRARSGTQSRELLQRSGGPRQVGQSRGARRAGRFQVWCVEGRVPPRCTLIDDVLTTGGTLTACAIALREAGAVQVDAVTFTRRL